MPLSLFLKSFFCLLVWCKFFAFYSVISQINYPVILLSKNCFVSVPKNSGFINPPCFKSSICYLEKLVKWLLCLCVTDSVKGWRLHIYLRIFIQIFCIYCILLAQKRELESIQEFEG